MSSEPTEPAPAQPPGEPTPPDSPPAQDVPPASEPPPRRLPRRQSAAATPAPEVTPEDMLDAMEKLEAREKGWVSKLITLFATLALFFFWRLMDSSTADVLILIGVLFIHELGHYIGMRVFDYRNVTMFFVPFLGAAVSGQKSHVEGWKQAVVSLLGPIPGIYIGLALAGIYILQPHALVWKVASIFILLNASQLLPIYPLDGGRFVNEVLFVRSRHLESVFRAVAGILLMLGAWGLGSWVLGFVGFFVLTSATYAWKVGLLAKEIKDLGIVDEGQPAEKMPIEVAYVLFGDLRRVFPHSTDAQGLATHAKAVWEKINARPPGLGATVVLVGVYVGTMAMLLAALIAFVVASSYSWDWNMQLGTRAFNGQRYNEAETHFQNAVQLADGFGKDDLRRADSFICLGRTLGRLEKNAEAEEALRESLRIREAALGPMHPDVAKALRALSVVVAKDKERKKEALALLERADSIAATQGPLPQNSRSIMPAEDSDGR